MVAIHVYKDMGRVPSIACDGRNRVGRSSLGCVGRRMEGHKLE
jgi:hypothetical protein